MSKSTGVTPVLGFAEDAHCEITASPAAAGTANGGPGITLTSIRTIAVRVKGTITGNATCTVTLGGQALVFVAGDFDPDGTATRFVRGAQCDADNNVVYATNAGTGSVSIDAVYFNGMEFE